MDSMAPATPTASRDRIQTVILTLRGERVIMSSDPMTPGPWSEAIERMLARIKDAQARVKDGFPHWADPDTGRWTTTPDGNWTGSYWIGMLWLAATATGDARHRQWAAPLAERLAAKKA